VKVREIIFPLKGKFPFFSGRGNLIFPVIGEMPVDDREN
jgi:hypothetical protein